MPKKPGQNADGMAARQIRVEEMMALGWSRAEMARQLGVSEGTIKRDCREIQSRNRESLSGVDSETLAADALVNSRIRVRRLDEIYRTSHSAYKLGALNQMRAEDKHIVDLLERLGRIRRVPIPIEITHRLMEKLVQLPGGDRAALSAGDLTDAEFTEAWTRLMGGDVEDADFEVIEVDERVERTPEIA